MKPENHPNREQGRYFLFAGFEYYPLGGMGDYRGCYPTIEEARKVYAQGHPSMGQWCWGHLARVDAGGELVMLDDDL